ncbi:T-cell-specific guanine nucleotide triphosphate-binding protein 1-like [Octodon degus]|uniref:T-cell-specific guanine nucleotide triphosphate-binding protein 1-like n=1 Tax=Octodon degus TaxID=10160 RepID=A0A6P6E9H4_OCTDE|nr:T-cell-specific guanine nucleotide triphosphate-binding protein 1-like [Octodon degus]XP_023568989.1 T-cell-specific guanine nucleotide triphosphate-binding protein 1-like [Octodon degus]XP_023568990.1 T-cell-specific guanine nucleotide triphosphate-binding protein 1-like [Octodon degus]
MGQGSSTDTNTESADRGSSFNSYFENFKVESRIISEETKDLIQCYLEKGDIVRAVVTANKALNDIENASLSIAVTGETGSGKSMLINALRGLGPEDKGAAATGPVETTMKRAEYKHPSLPSVSIWDLPGLGSTSFPPETYLEDVKFAEYDFFLIVSASRFKYNDVRLAQAIARRKKNFYFVRTKVDLDLASEKLTKPTAFNEDRILRSIRDDCVRGLQNAQVSAPEVFLISSLDTSQFDYPEMETALLRDLPAHKRHIFMLCLGTVTEAAIDRNRDALKEKAFLEIMKERRYAWIPLVGLFCESNLKKLEDVLTRYRAHFGLDDASLDKIAADFHVSVEELRARLQSRHLLLAQRDGTLGEFMRQLLEKVHAVTGGPFAASAYFNKTVYFHNYFLDTLATDAKALLKKEDLFGASASSA